MRSLLDRILNRVAARMAPLVATRIATVFGEVVQRHVEKVLLPQLRDRLAAELHAGLSPELRRGLARDVRDQLLPELRNRAEMLLGESFLKSAPETVTRGLAEHMAERVHSLFRAEVAKTPLIGAELYLPREMFQASDSDKDYMSASIPMTRDFLHPKYAEFSRLYDLPFQLHRKHWEWAFIHEHLERHGMLQPGKRGLGFGVGRERLPALFARAGATVTATDAPADVHNWAETDQHADGKEALFAPGLISREMFEERISFEPCDMTAVPEQLSGYDFCWSSCALEHLGSLEAGIRFILDSTERCLVPGGIACHTTELNLSSDEVTIEVGGSVYFRRRDLRRLGERLADRGHRLEPVRIEPGSLVPDYLVDLPPFHASPHLKLRIVDMGPIDFVATSLGLVIQRGP